MEARKRAAKELTVPLVIDESELGQLGLIKLRPLEALFARAEGCTDPQHDILKAFVLDSFTEALPTSTLSAYDNSMDELIGSEDSRTSSKPSKPSETDGDMAMLEGGAAFERAIGHNVPNGQGPRCYSFGVMAEAGTGVIGPSINHQKLGEGPDEALECIKRATTAISELHSSVLEFGLPSELKALLKSRAEIYNSATYGSERNQYFSGLQLNVAGPTKGTVCNLEGDLGTAGDGHIDCEDCAIGFTVMSSASKLRPGVHGGLFHLLEFGFFIELKYGVSVAFSGLHQHGGTAPIVPANMDFDPSDIRVTVISYPTRMILEDGGAKVTHHTSSSVNTSCKTSVAVPAQIHTGSFEPQFQVPAQARCCFARNGQTCMEANKLRTFLQCCRYSRRVAEATQEGYPSLDRLPPYEKWDLIPGDPPREAWELGPNGDPQLLEEHLKKLAWAKLRIAETVPSLFGVVVNPNGLADIPSGISSHYRLPLSRIDPCLTETDLSTDSDEVTVNAMSMSLDEATEMEPKAVSDNINSGPKKKAGRTRFIPEFPGSLAPSGQSVWVLGKRAYEASTQGLPSPDGENESKRRRPSSLETTQVSSDKTKQKSKCAKGATGNKGGLKNPVSLDTVRRSNRNKGRDRVRYNEIPEESGSEMEAEGVEDDVEDDNMQEPPCDIYASDRIQLLQLLSLDKVEAEVKRAEWDSKSVSKVEQRRQPGTIPTQSLSTSLHAIREMKALIQHDPLHIDCLKGLTKIWGELKNVMSISIYTKFVNRNLRHTIMLALHGLWKWLSVIRPSLDAAVRSLDTPEQAPSAGSYPWLTMLAAAVKSFYLSRMNSQEFQRSAYLAGTNSLKVVLYRRISRVPGIGEELRIAVMEYMEELLLRWVGFPDLIQDVATMHSFQNWDIQGQYVDILIAASGSTDILYLDIIWAQFANPLPAVFGRKKREGRKPSAEEWDTVRHDVRQSFSGPNGVHLRAGIRKYADICRMVNGQNSPYNQDQPIPTAIYQDGPWIDAAAEICAFLITLLPIIHLDPTTGGYRMISSPPKGVFCKYIMGEDRDWGAHQQKIRHQDHHIPFREIAPSRAEMAAVHEEEFRTREGLFSLAVWRGVTYGTSFTFRIKKIFSGPEEIEAEKKLVLEEQKSITPNLSEQAIAELHLCTIHAYGRMPNSSRSWDGTVMTRMWEASESWADFLGQYEGEVPFSAIYQWLTKVKMPQMSSRDSLTAYLLAVDLSYAGVLKVPTAREIGGCAFYLQKGALSALKDYQLAIDNPGKSNLMYSAAEKLCIDGFERLYKLVAAGLGEKQVKTVGFDPRMFEHTLCKISRLKKEGTFDLDQSLRSNFKESILAAIATI